MTAKRRAEMSGRLSGGREPETANDLTRGSGKTRFVQDSYTKEKSQFGRRGRYVTGTRVRAVATSLTDSDRQVVELLVTVGVSTGGQIRTLLWGESISAARQCRRQLAKLTRDRVLVRQQRRMGGVRSGADGYVYGLDIIGQAISGTHVRPRRPRPLGSASIDHAVAVTQCYLVVRELAAHGHIELVHFDAEPGSWREFPGIGGVRLLKPDGFLITAQGEYEDRWFLEVDRSTESPSRIKAKVEVYLSYFRSGREQVDHGVFPRVLWVVTDSLRQQQLVELFGKMPAEHWQLFQVATTNRFAATILSGAGDGEVAP